MPSAKIKTWHSWINKINIENNNNFKKEKRKALFGWKRLLSRAVLRGIGEVLRNLFWSVCICPAAPAVTNSLYFPGIDSRASVMNGCNGSAAWTGWTPSRQLSNTARGKSQMASLSKPRSTLHQSHHCKCHYSDWNHRACPTNAKGHANNRIPDFRMLMYAPGDLGIMVVWGNYI